MSRYTVNGPKARKKRSSLRRRATNCIVNLTVLFSAFFYGYMSLLEFGLGSFTSSVENQPRVYRERVSPEEIFNKLGEANFRRAYRMSSRTFHRLHRLLDPQLKKIFFPSRRKKSLRNNPSKYERSKYYIDTKIRLSIALRYFAGGSPYDSLLIHGVSRPSVYKSIWGVVDAVNQTEALNIKFPNHAEQREIARGFQGMSDAKFGNVVGAIDGILIWTVKPDLAWCKEIKCGEAKFKCYRKDKFGLNMQAICDDKLRFTYIDMRWPGSTSDYLAWVTSSLCRKLEDDDDILIDGATLVGDNAYVKKKYMAVPLKGQQSGYNDGYNFHQSQLRINIERAFGALVHRWAILRGPLLVPIAKVPPLVCCLCKLHNYLIDQQEQKPDKLELVTVQNLNNAVSFSNQVNRSNESMVSLSGEDNIPVDLLNGGDHAQDIGESDRRAETSVTPMDLMIKHCEDHGHLRPAVY